MPLPSAGAQCSGDPLGLQSRGPNGKVSNAAYRALHRFFSESAAAKNTLYGTIKPPASGLKPSAKAPTNAATKTARIQGRALSAG
jgi:hypothetical protein